MTHNPLGFHKGNLQIKSLTSHETDQHCCKYSHTAK